MSDLELNTQSFILNTLRQVMHLFIDYPSLQKRKKKKEEEEEMEEGEREEKNKKNKKKKLL